jgi:hypothetical protein
MCGREFRHSFDHCSWCDLDLNPDMPESPLLPERSWLPVGPDYASRDYESDPEALFDAVEQVLIARKWRLRLVDRQRLALAGSTSELPTASFTQQDVAVLLIPASEPAWSVRVAMQYSGRARQSGSGYSAEPELVAFLNALGAYLAETQ